MPADNLGRVLVLYLTILYVYNLHWPVMSQKRYCSATYLDLKLPLQIVIKCTELVIIPRQKKIPVNYQPATDHGNGDEWWWSIWAEFNKISEDPQLVEVGDSITYRWCRNPVSITSYLVCRLHWLTKPSLGNRIYLGRLFVKFSVFANFIAEVHANSTQVVIETII